VQERNRLLQNAPHYVKPLPTTIPIFKWTSGLLNAPLKFLNLLDRPSERGAIIIKMGLMMYDAYTRAQGTVPQHDFAFRAESLTKTPQLSPDILCTATYYDAMMPSPERICIDLLRDAQMDNEHAYALNYMRVGQAKGDTVELHDEVSGETIVVKPKIVVNAAGPWIDFANETMGQTTRLIGGTKGSHLVLDHPELRDAINGREFFFENADGRIVLIYPFLDRVMVGTLLQYLTKMVVKLAPALASVLAKVARDASSHLLLLTVCPAL
jgi:glycerol-3-phosphate dehydrogenase